MSSSTIHLLSWATAALLLIGACGGRPVTEETDLSSFDGYLVSGCWDLSQARAPQIRHLEAGADPDCRTDLWLVLSAGEPLCPDFRSPGQAILTSTCFFDQEQLPEPAMNLTVTRVTLRGRQVSVRVCSSTSKCRAEELGCLSCENRALFMPE